MVYKLTKILAVASIFPCTWGQVFAQNGKQYSRYSYSEKDLTIRLGATTFYAPKYEGADKYEMKGFPLIDISWQDRVFLNPRKGFGAFLWNRGGSKLGLSLGYTFGRDEDDSSDLNGLGDIDTGVSANVLVEHPIGKFSLDGRYEHQISGHSTGFQVNLGLRYRLRIGKQVMLFPSVKTSYGSADYMEEYFGITPGQSVNSGLGLHNADAGFKSVGVGFLAIYRLNQHWGIQALFGYNRLINDAADNPIVRNENQYRFGSGLSYKF